MADEHGLDEQATPLFMVVMRHMDNAYRKSMAKEAEKKKPTKKGGNR